MEEEEEGPPPQELPTIAIVATREQAGIINAAISHYLLHIARYPELELQEAVPQLAATQEQLIQQTRSLPATKEDTYPSDMKILLKLAALNALRVALSQAPPQSEAWEQAGVGYEVCKDWFRQHGIPIWFDPGSVVWRLGTHVGKEYVRKTP
jgi:hypothetical protein